MNSKQMSVSSIYEKGLSSIEKEDSAKTKEIKEIRKKYRKINMMLEQQSGQDKSTSVEPEATKYEEMCKNFFERLEEIKSGLKKDIVEETEKLPPSQLTAVSSSNQKTKMNKMIFGSYKTYLETLEVNKKKTKKVSAKKSRTKKESNHSMVKADEKLVKSVTNNILNKPISSSLVVSIKKPIKTKKSNESRLKTNEKLVQNSVAVSSQLSSQNKIFKLDTGRTIDNSLDNYGHELSSMCSSNNPALDDTYDNACSILPKTEEDLEYTIDEEAAQTHLNETKKANERKKRKKESRQRREAKKELNMKKTLADIKERGKHEAVIRLLRAHIQVLSLVNMMDECERIMARYQNKGRNSPKITDVNIYNTMLHSYASEGSLQKVKDLLKHMSKYGVKSNEQSYAAIFECIERSNAADKLSLLKCYQKEMEEKNISLNDIMDKSKFINDQRETVLKAARRLDPHFIPEYTPPKLDYLFPLLDKLKLDKIENRKGLLRSPADGVMTLDEVKERCRKQLDVEINGYVDIENVSVTGEQSDEEKSNTKMRQEVEKLWREQIREALEKTLYCEKLKQIRRYETIALYPYLTLLPMDDLVEIIMEEISTLVYGNETYSFTLSVLQRNLGQLVYSRYITRKNERNGVVEKKYKLYAKYCEWYMNRQCFDGKPLNGRQVWQQLVWENMEGPSLDIEESPWPSKLLLDVGEVLYNIILRDVKIDVKTFDPTRQSCLVPALYSVHRKVEGLKIHLEVMPHPKFKMLSEKGGGQFMRMRANMLPLLSPPMPWDTSAASAYLASTSSFIRVPFSVGDQKKLIQNAPPQSLYPVYDGLNQLGEVPWVINQPILDLQLEIFRSGGNSKLDIPPPQDPSTGHKMGAEMHSLWCDTLYKLSVANHFRNEVFWLPHNIDFRGRAYAIPPHLSQVSADAPRGLLLFAKTRPLGKDGLNWLKLHAINLTGTMKKNTIEERLKYADSIMDQILASADHPLDGEQWWMLSEEPWQTLACCKEIANAVRSPNHEEYVSGFPVHQDGSCNGLQHYAALGRDSGGARAVNLAPLDRPQDVYSVVVELVEEKRKQDAAEKIKEAVKLENFVKRKVIKQTVMTTVYGVTNYGARLQIAKKLEDIDSLEKDVVWTCARYLSNKTFESLTQMFTSTRLIQDWLTDCADVISRVCGESVEWVTPLGLPVVQPYYRERKGNGSLITAALDQWKRPHTVKQRNAFPPNFIHSLDASHMMLTGLHCQAAGVTFVSVHDCFWTHPETADIMNRICREQFLSLHNQTILQDLSKYFIERYSYPESETEEGMVGAESKRSVNKVLREVPKQGDFDLNQVLDSIYFFS